MFEVIKLPTILISGKYHNYEWIAECNSFLKKLAFAHDYYVAFCKAYNMYCIYNEPIKDIVSKQKFAADCTDLSCTLNEFFAVTTDVKIKYLYYWADFKKITADSSVRMFLRWIVHNSSCCELDETVKTVHYCEANYLFKEGQVDYLSRPMACDALSDVGGARKEKQVKKINKKWRAFCLFICDPSVPMVFYNDVLEQAIKDFFKNYKLPQSYFVKCGPIPEHRLMDGLDGCFSFEWYFTYHDLLYCYSCNLDREIKYKFMDWFISRITALNAL